MSNLLARLSRGGGRKSVNEINSLILSQKSKNMNMNMNMNMTPYNVYTPTRQISAELLRKWYLQDENRFNNSYTHWYKVKSGEPLHFLPLDNLTKMAKQSIRPVTLFDAKRLHLVPSVTSVLSIVSNPKLDTYRVKLLTNSAWETISKLQKTDFLGTIEEKTEQIQTQAEVDDGFLKEEKDFYGMNSLSDNSNG